ncbi:hypothetical protein BHJ80_10490 [Escherichia coli]|nr:hypothetical protein BHJ80_10490 [Escherichia coli]
MSQLCPCGSAVEYSLCCHPYVSGEKVAPDPEHLMRSRYCAFVWSSGVTCRQKRCLDAHTEWLGLTVFEHCWQDADNIGFVSFVARFTEGGKTGAIIERSRFLKENGQWYYIDGTRPQFGRNDPCPCGSGKKFKKCCGQ